MVREALAVMVIGKDSAEMYAHFILNWLAVYLRDVRQARYETDLFQYPNEDILYS